MATTGLTTFLFGYNLEKIVYPWREAIASALPISDQVIFCECFSEDNTWAEVQQLAAKEPKLLLTRHPWGNHYTIQSFISNHCLRLVQTPWVLKLDADECIHHDSYSKFVNELRQIEMASIKGCRPHYTHFTPDFDTTFPFIYDRKATVVYLPYGWHFGTGYKEDACEFTYQHRPPVVDVSLEIYHYGKVQTGRRREALHKELDFTALYTELGFPDRIVVKQSETTGVIDYNEVFQVAKARGLFQPFTNTHPQAMLPYIERMKAREAAGQ